MQKKIIIVSSLASALLVAGVVFAADFSLESQKFFDRFCTKSTTKGVHAFVCDLRQRVDALGAGVVGPQGPEGPQGDLGVQGPIGPEGPAGPKGDTGDQGPAGPSGAAGVVKVFDANGNELGPLVGWTTSGVYRHISTRTAIFYEPLHRIIEIQENNGRLGRPTDLYYTTSTSSGAIGCPGTPYLVEDFNIGVNFVFSSIQGKHYILDRDASETLISWCSTVEADNPLCQIADGFGSCEGDILVRKATLVDLPFDDPVAMPLRFGFN